MIQYDVVVVGGGAAGMTAAIFAKRAGRSVLLCEKMPKLGKKILASGAGRCNILSDKVGAEFYNTEARALAASVFGQFGKDKILGFFKELGLEVYTQDDGRMFPVTDQASSVLKVLEMELERLKVSVGLNCEVKNLHIIQGGFELKLSQATPSPFRHTSLDGSVLWRISSLPSKRGRGPGEGGRGDVRCGEVILAGGGRSYPALGSDGNAYALAQKFGHTIVEPVPSTVALLVKDPWCHSLQGQKIRAAVTNRIQNKNIRTVSGELLFTQYGLSGTAILDVSEEISIAMNRERIREIQVEADLLPSFSEEALKTELSRRLARGISAEHLLEGLLPAKFSAAMKSLLGKKDLAAIILDLKHRRFKVDGTRGWNEAEFTAGGVATGEVHVKTLESKIQKGLYLAGEMLDVNGHRGGHNLAWAWASGAVAGSQK